MSDPVTNNYSLTQPTVGGDLNTWGSILNAGAIGALDTILGANFAVAITTNDVTITTSQFQNAIFIVSGALTGDRSLIIPLSPNSATLACGGRFVVVNNTTGGYNLTVLTAATASTGIVVPQGFTAFLYSDGTNVGYCSNGLPGYALASNGNPNGALAGTAASANTNAQFAFDYVNSILYICTTTGNAAAAVWTNVVAAGASLPIPQGYLTPTSGVPIITAGYGPGETNSAATVLYYTPYFGNWTVIHNGNILVSYKFSELQLTLSPSQAANNIYDVFLAYNAGTPVIGTGPSWAAGTAGNITAGTCARGTSVGGTALTRFNGFRVNAASLSLIYNTGSGNNTITVAANQGIYLGSIYIDATAGQVSVQRVYGQNRKWGIYNAYNRTPVYLKSGDPASSWNYSTSALRASNGAPASWSSTEFNAGSGTACNGFTVFDGLGESMIDVSLGQNVQSSTGGDTLIAVGVNSLLQTGLGAYVAPQGNGAQRVFGRANYVSPPLLGINTFVSLENGGGGTGVQFLGTQANMMLYAQYLA